MDTMQHDSEGNVVSAPHKGIRTIEYHPTSQRTTTITLIDDKMLLFYYDAQGERILKQFAKPSGEIIEETQYLRDSKGRVMVDRRIQYPSHPQPPKITQTAYIYGTRGLLGFIRNDRFYSVFTDHAGCVRLVVHGGK